MKEKPFTTIGDLQKIMDNKSISAYAPGLPNNQYLRIKYEDEYYRLHGVKENEKSVVVILSYEIPFSTSENYSGEKIWNNAQVLSVVNDIMNISPEKTIKFKLGITCNKFLYDKNINTILIQ